MTNSILYILRKTIEGYLDSVPFLTFNTIKNKLIMHAFHSSRYLQSKRMFDISHASMIKSTVKVNKRVCFVVALRPKSTAMVIAGRSVHLTTLFPGQA